MATKKSAVPARIQPQLVALVTRPPAGDWAYEIKFDGYRMFARIDAGVALFTKNGYDWTKRMPRSWVQVLWFGKSRDLKITNEHH